MGRRARRGEQPSDAAQHRLASAIHRTRAELEVQVTEGLLRSEVFLQTGRPEQAAAVLEQQRRRVVDFEDHLRDALAAAAAEAEAEAVLAGVAGVEVLHDDEREPAVSRVPQLVAASLALVLSVALAGAFSTGTDRDGLQAAVRIDATDPLPSRAPDVAGPAIPDGLRFREPLLSRTPGPAQRPDEAPAGGDAAARAWIAQQDTLLERLGVNLALRNEVLSDLEQMVGTLVPGTPLADQMWLQVLSDAVAELGTGQDLDASDETDPDAAADDTPSDEADEPAAEPSEDPASEGDEPWFGGRRDEPTEADDGDADDAATGEDDSATGTATLLPREE